MPMVTHQIYNVKFRQQCLFVIYVFKVSEYVVFPCAFTYRPLFDP